MLSYQSVSIRPLRLSLATFTSLMVLVSVGNAAPAADRSGNDERSTAAAAESADGRSEESAHQPAPTELPAVTVTAQRRSEDANRVPLSLTVLKPEHVQAYGASGRDILQLGGRAPSVYAESSFGRTFPRFYIRGLGNTDFDLNASQPVSMVLDDVVQENPALKGFPMFDLDRVEVLRGPQGTLFGRNTPGGVIKFESVRPDAEPSGYARLGYGRFDLVNFEGAVGGAVSENSSARLSVLYQARDDFSRNTFVPGDRREGFTERALRGQWLFDPGTGFEGLFQTRARKLNGGSAVFRANLFQPGSNDFAPGFRRFRLAQDAQPTLDVKSAGLSARLSWDLGEYRLVSISAWDTLDMFARGDVDGGFGAAFAPPFGPGPIPFPAESGDGIPKHDQLTQELRLESGGDRALSWQLGAFLFHERLDIDNVNYDTLAGSIENGR
ncbi:MAG: TonB-dependent receptor, partial [Lysobacterales bacterium]